MRSQLLGVGDQRDQQVAGCERAQFAERRLNEDYPYLILDARYEKVREAGVIVSQAVLVAVGVDGDGRRQILAVELANRESRSSWRDFLAGAQGARAAGVEFVVSDNHEGLKRGDPRGLARGGVAALLRTLPQKRARLRAAQGRRRLPAGVALVLRPARYCRGAARHRRLARQMAAKYPRLCDWVEDNIEETLTYYRLPLPHHKHMKSTNMLERLNQELKRRTHVVRIFPNAESCLRLVRALAVEMHENWLEASRYLNMDHLNEHKKEALRLGRLSPDPFSLAPCSLGQGRCAPAPPVPPPTRRHP